MSNSLWIALILAVGMPTVWGQEDPKGWYIENVGIGKPSYGTIRVFNSYNFRAVNEGFNEDDALFPYTFMWSASHQEFETLFEAAGGTNNIPYWQSF